MELTTNVFGDRCRQVFRGLDRIGVILQLADNPITEKVQWAAYTVGYPGVRIEGIPICETWEEVLELWKEKA